jgi:hypothetical protein
MTSVWDFLVWCCVSDFSLLYLSQSLLQVVLLAFLYAPDFFLLKRPVWVYKRGHNHPAGQRKQHHKEYERHIQLLKDLNPHKASGPDQIPTRKLKLCSSELAPAVYYGQDVSLSMNVQFVQVFCLQLMYFKVKQNDSWMQHSVLSCLTKFRISDYFKNCVTMESVENPTMDNIFLVFKNTTGASWRVWVSEAWCTFCRQERCYPL